MSPHPATAPLANVQWRHEFRPGDLGRIVGLHGTVYAREFGWSGWGFEAMVAEGLGAFARTLPERAAAGQDQLWVAEIGGVFAGSVAISGRAPDRAQLRWLIVAPERRGLGLGRRLVEEALGWCRVQGFHTVRLFTTGEQTAAIALYHALGFHKTDEDERHARWGASVVQQWYELHFSPTANPSPCSTPSSSTPPAR